MIGVGILLLVGLLSSGKWFCSSHNLLTTFINETAYCTFSGTVYNVTATQSAPSSHNYYLLCTGIAFTYILAQIGLWLFFHSLGLFWSVAFPLHLRKFRAEKKLKYIHVTTVLIALLLPLVPALLHLMRPGAIH